MNTTMSIPFTKSLAKYYAITRVSWKNTQAFLINTLTRSGIVVLRIGIFFQVYLATYTSNNITTVNGFDVNMVVWSLVFAQSIQSATRPPVSNAIQEEVQSGTLSYSINRPYSFILFQLFNRLGTFLLNVGMNIGLVAVVAWLIVGAPYSITPMGLFAGLILLLGGFLLDFWINMIIGICAFWLEDIKAINWMYSKGMLILGGLVIPLPLFPDNLRSVVELLPFPYLFASSAQQIVNFESDIFIKFLGIQIIWILVFAFISKILFSHAIKYVSHNGG
jgi:ABC-2 type transport system permease protein